MPIVSTAQVWQKKKIHFTIIINFDQHFSFSSLVQGLCENELAAALGKSIPTEVEAQMSDIKTIQRE